MGAACSCCSPDSPMFKVPDAYTYSDKEGQVAKIQIEATIPLDLSRCKKQTAPPPRKPSTGGYDMRKIEQRIGNLEKEASKKPMEMKVSEDTHSREDNEHAGASGLGSSVDAEEMPTDSLLEQTSDNVDEAPESAGEDVADAKDTLEDAQDVADKGCSLGSIFSCCNPFGSSKETVEFDDDECDDEPAPSRKKKSRSQPKAKSTWSFGATLGGLTKPSAPSNFSQAPYGAGKNGVDKLCAVAAKRLADGLDVRHDADQFINAQKYNIEEVAGELTKHGAPEHLVQTFIKEHIDGDTLRYMQVEDIMRVCDLELYKARGLYTKIWRILGITMIGEALRIEAVDSKPTGDSLVKMVQKRMYAEEGRSDEGRRYVENHSVEKPEKMEMKEEDSPTKQVEGSDHVVETTSNEGKKVEGGFVSTPAKQTMQPMVTHQMMPMGQMTPQQIQIMQMQMFTQQQQQMKIQQETAGKDGATS